MKPQRLGRIAGGPGHGTGGGDLCAPGSILRRPPQDFLLTLWFRCVVSPSDAGIAQLVERNLAKVEVASSSLVSRSNGPPKRFNFGGALLCLTPERGGRGASMGGRAMREFSGIETSTRGMAKGRRTRKTPSVGASIGESRAASADLRSSAAASSLRCIDVRLRALRLPAVWAVHDRAALHRGWTPHLSRPGGRLE